MHEGLSTAVPGCEELNFHKPHAHLSFTTQIWSAHIKCIRCRRGCFSTVLIAAAVFAHCVLPHTLSWAPFRDGTFWVCYDCMSGMPRCWLPHEGGGGGIRARFTGVSVPHATGAHLTLNPTGKGWKGVPVFQNILGYENSIHIKSAERQWTAFNVICAGAPSHQSSVGMNSWPFISEQLPPNSVQS